MEMEVISETRNKGAYTEKEAVEQAVSLRHTTVLLTSEGKIYYSCYSSNDLKLDKHDKHAEKVLLEEPNETLRNITYLYIKNSPCAECSSLLIQYYRAYSRKPKIYIGRIYNLEDTNDKEGLKKLLVEGFEILVWEELNERLKNRVPNDKKERAKYTNNYLKKLKGNIIKYRFLRYILLVLLILSSYFGITFNI